MESVKTVMGDFFKFPSTIHLAYLDDQCPRSDKCMSIQERNTFLTAEVIVEEKIDGANLGISFDANGCLFLQNRGNRLVEPFDGQWRLLRRWVEQRESDLFDFAEDRCILFGEWCYARHSVSYDALPDWFVLFDVYDRACGRFYSVDRRNEVARHLGLAQVPHVARGRFSFNQLSEMSFVSNFGHEEAEGIYLRRDAGEWLQQRAKLVRPAFRQSIEAHWSKRGIHANSCIGQNYV